MPPAFSSTRQAAAFALLLLFLVAAPWLAHQTFLPHRAGTYSSESLRWEKFPWLQKFIFDETNDIDIAFVGSSHICDGIDTPYVQQQLDKAMGRKTVVRTVAWFYPGFDSLYFFTKELLAHRKVNTMVFYDECAGPLTYNVHRDAPFWFRYGEDNEALNGLPFKFKAMYYYAAMIGMPRNILNVLLPNLPPEPNSQMTGPFAYKNSPNPETTLGCIVCRSGYSQQKFLPFDPQTGANPADLRIFGVETATNFAFFNRPIPDSQIYFSKKFASLVKEHGCHLVELHMPLLAERTTSVIPETRNWPKVMQLPVRLMGIPGDRLFDGLSEAKTELLYSDWGHLNANGQKYFTPLVTPSLIQFYEEHAHH